MQEQLNEKLSLLIDDELESNQAFSLLRNINSDQSLKDKLHRYQLVSQVIKNEPCQLLDNRFADYIHEQINSEPFYFIPEKKTALTWRKAGVAVAASILLALLGVIRYF
jgi:sigma-E factor negative regulatory protein RseA